jgi:hypothetical protein
MSQQPPNGRESSTQTPIHLLPTFIVISASEAVVPEVTLTRSVGSSPGSIVSPAHTIATFQSKAPPYNEDFYNYAWFHGLVVLLLTSTVLNATIVMLWAEWYGAMNFFSDQGLPTILQTIAHFHAPPTYVYVLLFVRIPNSASIAELLIKRVCNRSSEKIQRRVLVAFHGVLLLSLQFAMAMSFYLFYPPGSV